MTFDPVHCAALRIFAATACCAVLLACTEQTAQSGSTAPEQSNLAATEDVDPAASFDESKTEQIDDSAAAAIRVRRNDPAVINFEGFGPAQFGDDQESVRIAWGRPLEAGEPAPGSTCHYLVPDPPMPGEGGIAFMIEDGKFVRYDVDDPSVAAPGDIVIGETAEEVIAAFPDNVDIQPHKYEQGATYFVVTSPEGADARLIFEMNPVGRVVRWRIGVPPQVHYVEGCG